MTHTFLLPLFGEQSRVRVESDVDLASLASSLAEYWFFWTGLRAAEGIVNVEKHLLVDLWCLLMILFIGLQQ